MAAVKTRNNEHYLYASIEKGYAGNQTEVIRQAILAYERMLEEEELMLVHKAVQIEMEEIKAGRVKTHSFEEITDMSAGTNHTNKYITLPLILV